MKKRLLTLLLSSVAFAHTLSAGEISAAFFDGEAVVHGHLEDPSRSDTLSSFSDTLKLWSHSDNSTEVYEKVHSMTRSSFSGFAIAKITHAGSEDSQTVYFYMGDDSELYAVLDDGFVIHWERP